mgnify:CR=1 FL=1
MDNITAKGQKSKFKIGRKKQDQKLDKRRTNSRKNKDDTTDFIKKNK